MSLLVEHGQTLLILACIFGFFMAWGIGANDVSNAMGTSVGSGALTVWQALFIAAIFEFAGAYLAGGEVTDTIRSGIVDSAAFVGREFDLALGMVAALLASGIWLLVASMAGWPVSTTHSIVGAIAGFSAVGVGMEAVQWDKFGDIALSWLISPVFAATVAFFIFKSVQWLILDRDDPFERAKRYLPGYIFFGAWILSFLTITKGLKHVGLHLDTTETFAITTLTGIVCMAIGIAFLQRVSRNLSEEKTFRYASVERLFAVLMVFSACAMAFAHGSNDVANAVGPIAAVVNAVEHAGETVSKKAVLPSWVLLLGAIGIVIGLFTYGYKVIGTIGKKITELTPSRGFSAELAAATTVILASALGMPVSTTHVLVGAVMGVGLARGLGALNLGVLGAIAGSWLITVPAGAILSIIIFFVLKFFLV
jgi:PiT family inorganic phosphate transporter